MKKLLLYFALMMLPLAASAYDVRIDGVTYSLYPEDNTAEVISASHYFGDHLTIPETITYDGVVYRVTGIGRWAFMRSELTSISIPNSVTTIPISAFEGSKLTSITIPGSVKSIEEKAFEGCDSLKKVIVPDIAAWCGIKFKSPPSNPLTYAHHLYSDENTEIKDLVIPDNVTMISKYAFSGCSGLTSVTFSENFESIFDYAFRDCSGLTSVNFDNVKALYTGAFFGCSGLTSLTMNITVRSYGFANCTGLTSVTANRGIFSYGFANCTGLTSVTLNCDVGSYGFANCTGLTSVTFGDSVTKVGDNAFAGCPSQTSLVLPELATIGDDAFVDFKLENVLTKGTTTKFQNAFSDRTYQHAMLYIPEGTWAEAVYEGSWYMFNNIREVAMTPESLSPGITYTLMDAKTFGYATYDEASNGVRMAKAFYCIDEKDANNIWQVKSQGGRRYLYNKGSGKYASIASDGHILLSETPVEIEMTETDNGIMLGTDSSRRWAFINNGSHSDAMGIDGQSAVLGQEPSCCYTLDGQHQTQPKRGLNIIKMNNGTTKKVIIR